jgi:hypothetical protein
VSTRLAEPGQAWCGVARQGEAMARAHDVHMNSPMKSGPKPHRSVTSFCHLVFL